MKRVSVTPDINFYLPVVPRFAHAYTRQNPFLDLLTSNAWRCVRSANTQRIQEGQGVKGFCGRIVCAMRPPRAPRNLSPSAPPTHVGRCDKPTWRCQQIPLIGALGIQVICYPRRAFQERLINDRRLQMDQPLEDWRGRG